VEDDVIDTEFTLRSFDKLKIANEITVAVDGYEALDIQMPRINNGRTMFQVL